MNGIETHINIGKTIIKRLHERNFHEGHDLHDLDYIIIIKNVIEGVKNSAGIYGIAAENIKDYRICLKRIYKELVC